MPSIRTKTKLAGGKRREESNQFTIFALNWVERLQGRQLISYLFLSFVYTFGLMFTRVSFFFFSLNFSCNLFAAYFFFSILLLLLCFAVREVV